MTSAEIRQAYIDFFVKKHGHTFVASSPVVPQDDPTLLFTNAGMNQFKPYFLGTEKAPYPRAVDTQKCIRAGGKHNDLDDVGRSRRHHTFFEMLGNWSFGDYFKQGAIEMAWELVTEVFKIDPMRIHVTCYEGNEAAGIPRDMEAAEIWRKVANWEKYGGKSDEHIHFLGAENFWEMGETGPCGPCTEIFIDRTPGKTGGPSVVKDDDPLVMEFWNNVFIQYNRDGSGKLTPLPAQHVDTGMGFERICQILQDKKDNYGTDLWTPLFEALTKISGLKYEGKFPKNNVADPVAEAADEQLRHDIAFRVIADHVRCLTFALTDGAVPSNEGRGYVLRRILRRAVRFGRQQLGLQEPFMYKLVGVVVETMGGVFPELKKNPGRVVDLVKEEEESFGRTLDRGILLFEEATARSISNLKFEISKSGNSTGGNLTGRNSTSGNLKTEDLKTEGLKGRISAEDAFRLYDTYGFPVDLTRIMAEERGMTVDLVGYEKLMEEAKERSRAVDKSVDVSVQELPPDALPKLAAQNVQATDDSAKFLHKPSRGTIKAIWDGREFHTSIDTGDNRPGEQVAIILDKTSFYAEMGGQVGDVGEIRTDGGDLFEVETTRGAAGYVLHIGHIRKGAMHVGAGVTAMVMGGRDSTMKHHTTTHMANWALREVLGEGVQQKGSLVDPEKLRFDFSYGKGMTEEEVGRVEGLVNEAIARKMPVYAEVVPQEAAMKICGLRAVFGEKYPPMVRVVSVGAPVGEMLADPGDEKWRGYSVEFCGGTHLGNSGEAEGFVIVADEAVSKGVRRMVGVTGKRAREAADQAKVIESLMSQGKETTEANLPGVIAALQKAVGGEGVPLRAKREGQRVIAELQGRHKEWVKGQGGAKEAGTGGGEGGGGAFDAEKLLAAAAAVGGVMLVVAQIPNASADTLRNTWDWLKKKHPQGNVAALLASEVEDVDKDGNKLPPKVSLLAAVGDPVVGKLKAGDWIKAVAAVVGGSGGGRPQMAMAGGKDVGKIGEALEVGRKIAGERLG